MCDPMTALAVASTAASVGGGIVQGQNAAHNQKAAINAKNAATADTISKENGLQQQSTGIFNQALQPYQGTMPQQNLTAAQGADTAALTNNAPTAAMLAGGATTGNAPQVVKDSENSTIANRVANIGTKASALGNLTGYDTNNQNNARGVQDAKSQIGTIGDFANEDANVGNALSQAAQANSQQAPSPWGDLLTGAGQLGSFYAGKGGAFSNLFKAPANMPVLA